VEDDWRERKKQIDDWKRRFASAKARSANLTMGDPPEKVAAIRAELEDLMAEWERIGPASET
jgi:hypothetical protein